MNPHRESGRCFRCIPRSLCAVLLAAGVLASPGRTLADAFFDQFIDPKDGKLDTSQWLASRTGFLPIPIVVSDPAVGYGGGLALAFFHDSENRPPPGGDINARMHLPPSISFVAGAQTDNGSWLAGAGHIASWKKDSIRYTGLLGYGDLNLEYYGVRPGLIARNRSLSFDIQGTFFYQQLLFRIKDSNVFLGGRYSFLGADVGFDAPGPIPGAPRRQFNSNTGGLGMVLRYDSRDNILSPDKGVFAKFEPMFFNRAFGGDYDYTKTKLSGISYWPVSDVVIGVRLEGEFANGDVPFYDVPFISMRGIPALRYQGEDVVVTEVEARWDVTSRWSLVGFAGSGWAADRIDELGSSGAVVSKGVGFRYLLARRLGLRVGLDVARGPEDTVVYVAVGTNWN